MNIILVLIDSVNRNDLEPYGGTAFKTPNLAAFAERALRFDNHFVGSLPCMPARREIFSGFREVLWRPWGPLEPFDHRLPKMLRELGYGTAIVTDHYHYWEEAANGYIQSFESSELIRGHELDFWKPQLPDADLPQWVQLIERYRPGLGRRYYSNVADFDDERDFFPAKVMSAACEWLGENRDGRPFFLQVESFDVHEPFDAPEPYASMYGNGDDRDRFDLWPPYQDAARQAEFMAATSDEELAFIRSQYGAKLTMVDHWLGELMKTLDRENLWDDTAVIVTTDHGHDLGERGNFGKQYPHFDSHANIPLLVWDPRHPGGGRAATGLTATIDLFATLLEMAGGTAPENSHSRSIVPLVAGDSSQGRDAVIYGTFGQGLCCTDGEWTIMQPPDRSQPLYAYSTMIPHMQSPAGYAVNHGRFIPDVPMPQWQIPMPMDGATARRPGDDKPMLFHRAADPGQEKDLWDERPDQRERMLSLMANLVSESGAPDELYDRLHLRRPSE
ncbi:sulfatase [Consotaella aegiceratis]|uniref:sulfatase n=1 Tax=Consotaella aegiceratis TaxID=3097961 RepID=UPI002F3EDB68